MEDNLRNTFFELLRMGLWGKGKLSVAEPLSDEDWAVLYQYALNHTVEGILFDSFSLLTEEELPPRALRMKWTVRVDQIERRNIMMNDVIAEQHAYFTEHGLKSILLKGQGVASCYLNPLHRMSGDVDWYFEEDGYDKIIELWKDRGIYIQPEALFSVSYDWKQINIEHHRLLFDICNPFASSYLKKLQMMHHNQTLLIRNQSVELLAPELQILQVNVHILKHLLFFGIGLRQICDAAVLYYAYRDKIDVEKLRHMYKKVGILKWVHVLHDLLVKYMGLPEEDLPFPYPDKLDADWMMNEIWCSGNFGFYDPRFSNGKVSETISVRPDGLKRILLNVRRYSKYALGEAIFYPVSHIYSRFRKSI